MPLLAGLDSVPWASLSHAYGEATDVPDLLRALVDPDGAPAPIRAAADDKPIREHVIWTLYGNVFHQGTVWQVTPHVIPFLVEILADGPREAELQSFVLEYLRHLSHGYPGDMFPDLIEPSTHFAAADAAPDDPSDPLDNANMARYARDCYRAVEGALPTVVRFARDRDPDVAQAAIALLGSFRTDTSADALRDAVASSDGRPRAAALVALAQLDPATTRAQAATLLADPDRYTSIHAAVALLLADPETALDDAIDRLTQPLDILTEEHSPLTDSVGKLVSASLARLPARHIERVVDAIGATLATSDAMTNLSASQSLLRLVFPGPAPSDATALTLPQRKALHWIADHGAFRWGDGDFGNYFLMLREWGLPAKPAALRAWLTPPQI